MHEGSTQFPTTRWTVILAAKSSPEARREALKQLMTVYWRPLYVFFRRKGLTESASQDAVQEVLLLVLERDAIERVSPEKGRLRAYLRTVAGHWLISQHERDSAAKRGAGAMVVSFDDDPALAERLASADALSAEDAYERAWAQTVMDRALLSLKAEYESGARSGPWAVIALFFGGGPTPSYRDVAREHGMSLPQLKAFLHRARVRYRELVQGEVLETVAGSAEAEGELLALTQALSA